MAQYNKEKDIYVDRNNNLFDVVMLADQDGNIINSSSVAANINIASGALVGYQAVHHFGAVPSMSQSNTGTIWDINDTKYPWNVFSNGLSNVISIETTLENGSISTLDDGLVITIYGLDADYNQIQEDVSINGSTGLSNLEFFRINNVIAYDPSNGDRSNLTNITLYINNTIVDRVSIGKSRSLSTTYTIPAGWTAYLTQGTTSCSAASDATVDMYVRNLGGSFVIAHTLEVSGFGGQYKYEFSIPGKIDERSDIDLRATVRQNNSRVTAAYDLVLVETNLV